MGETSGMTLGIKEPRQKLHRAPTALYKTPLPQQSSSSAREEEYHWELREERRRHHCIARTSGGPLQFGISIQKVAQQAMNEDGQKIVEVFWQDEAELCIASWVRWRRSGKAQSIWKEGVKTWVVKYKC